ncbi:hypothetical protein APY04_1247 [Hyphomicrobium sulfonivorans]|uniref:Uncharacterized protein n=1 Tax=Hyphomicrobium sulfonivorans TaxID=121290 RepID=A0A109BJR2_HYPSL|nr:hypothetical protein APY04_1247 [Hyphomicrobium sulfonivorans]
MEFSRNKVGAHRINAHSCPPVTRREWRIARLERASILQQRARIETLAAIVCRNRLWLH